jgi:hypothetical protein
MTDLSDEDHPMGGMVPFTPEEIDTIPQDDDDVMTVFTVGDHTGQWGFGPTSHN